MTYWYLLYSQEAKLADPHQHSFTEVLDSKVGQMNVAVTMGVSRVAEPHRMVKVFASLLVLEDTDIRLRESAWMTIEELSDATEGVVVQMCYRLEPERPSTPRSTLAQAHAAYFEAVVVEAHGKKMRDVLLQHQATLVDAFGVTALGNANKTPSLPHSRS